MSEERIADLKSRLSEYLRKLAISILPFFCESSSAGLFNAPE